MSRITELAALEELDKDSLVKIATSLGIAYAQHIDKYYANDKPDDKKTALAYEIRRKLGYFDVMVEFSHVDISHLPSAIKSVYDPPINRPLPLGMKRPDTKHKITEKVVHAEIPPIKVFELNVGMGVESYNELVEKWMHSLSLTGLYEDEGDIERDVRASIEAKRNRTRFPVQDLTFFVRDKEGKCSLSVEELVKCSFLPLDGLDYSVMGLKRFIESTNNRARYASVFDKLKDAYLEYELHARGVPVSRHKARETAQELNTDIIREPITVDGLRDAPRVPPPLSNIPLVGAISVNNIAVSIKSTRFSKEAMKFLANLPPQDLMKVMENIEAKPFTDQNDNLQYLFLKAQYLGFAEPASFRGKREVSLEEIESAFEAIPKVGELMKRYTPISQYIRSGAEIQRLTEKEATGADTFWDTVNDQVPRSVMAFDYLNFTNIHEAKACPKRPAEDYSNEMMYHLAELYGYSQQARVHTPASFLVAMNPEARDREMERALAVVLSGKNIETVRRWVMGDDDLSKLQEIAKNPRLYMGLIMGKPAPDFQALNYADQDSLTEALSSVTDNEIIQIYSLAEWSGRAQAIDDIMQMARDTLTWRYFDNSSVLCNNGAVDTWGGDRVGQPQISVGSFNNLTCLTLFELIMGFLDETPTPQNEVLTHVIVHSARRITVTPKEDQHFDIETRDDVFFSEPGEYVLTPTYPHIRGDFPEVRRMNPDSVKSLQVLLSKSEMFSDADGPLEVNRAAKALVDQLVSDFNDPAKQGVLAGVGFVEYFNSKSAHEKESILRILAGTLVMGMMARFWLTSANIAQGFPLTLRDIGNENQGREPTEVRDRALLVYTDVVIKPFVGAVRDLGNNLVMVRAAKIDLLLGKVQLIKRSLLQTILLSMSGDLCVKDLSDRLTSTAWYYYSKLNMEKPFQEMLKDFYPQIRDRFNANPERPYSLPMEVPEFSIETFQLTQHVDPLRGQ